MHQPELTGSKSQELSDYSAAKTSGQHPRKRSGSYSLYPRSHLGVKRYAVSKLHPPSMPTSELKVTAEIVSSFRQPGLRAPRRPRIVPFAVLMESN